MRLPGLVALMGLALAACAPQAAPARAPADSSAGSAPPAAAPAGAATVPAAGAASGAGAQAATAAPPESPIPLKVATQRLASDVGLYVAQDRGYFTEQALEVEFIEITTGGGSIPPLSAGQLDVGVGSNSPGLWNAIARGIDIKLVATKGSTGTDPDGPFSGSQALVLGAEVAASGAVQDYRDLRGKAVALPDRGATLEIALTRALQRGGLTIDDVEIKLMPYPDMLAALANRSVDAAMELEPFITQGAARGILVRWKVGAELYPGQQAASVVYGPTMMRMGGNAGNRFMVAYTRGLRDYNDAFGPKQLNRADLIAILARNTTVKDPELYERMGRGFFNPDCYLNLDPIAADLQWYVANGHVPQPPDMAQAVDHSYCDYAVQQLGRYQP
jgi:ABC-type nitrate/sulfonate/bicarbonate transport system substrate-binding protein